MLIQAHSLSTQMRDARNELPPLPANIHPAYDGYIHYINACYFPFWVTRFGSYRVGGDQTPRLDEPPGNLPEQLASLDFVICKVHGHMVSQLYPGTSSARNPASHLGKLRWLPIKPPFLMDDTICMVVILVNTFWHRQS